MSLWSRLKRHLAGEDGDEGEREGGSRPPARPATPASSSPGPAAAPPTPDPAAEIAAAIRAGDVDDARVLAWIRTHRGTTAEGALVRALAEAAPHASETVRIATAELLASRGEEVRALEVLEGVSSAPGLVLAADLLAASGRLPRAISAIERVLAKELDAPGARERHDRWRAGLGLGAPAAGRLDEATVVQPSGDEAPFRLLREVARGGAGTVYEAEDELLGRRVAFKVHHARGADRPALEREVRAAAELAGPGVLRLLDASPPAGWVALEWVGRGSIRDVLRRGDAAILVDLGAWMPPLARALARVHRMGWVHGDVKPGNVLLRAPHDPVLGDFGLARRAGAAAVGGSPGYVSPERLEGRPVHPRDDVYGFGRVVEDVLEALARQGQHPPAAARRLAELCMGNEERRPADGGALVHLLAAAALTHRAVGV